jgi:hypothetical protein
VSAILCLSCKEEFIPGPPRGGRAQLYCGSKCRVAAGNSRRAITRKGRKEPSPPVTNPRVTSPTPPTIPPSVDTSVSEPRRTRSERIAELMALAHSRTGIDAWQVAELAKLRGISPWAPLRIILAKEGPRK